MDQLYWLFQSLSVLVHAAVIHQIDDKRIQGSNWLVRLLLLDIADVGVDQVHRLHEFYVVVTAYESIFAVTESTSKLKDTEDGPYEFYGQSTD